jgi:hypothetical protein
MVKMQNVQKSRRLRRSSRNCSIVASRKRPEYLSISLDESNTMLNIISINLVDVKRLIYIISEHMTSLVIGAQFPGMTFKICKTISIATLCILFLQYSELVPPPIMINLRIGSTPPSKTCPRCISWNNFELSAGCEFITMLLLLPLPLA